MKATKTSDVKLDSAKQLVEFTVNGDPVRVFGPPNRTLLDVLRNDLELLGAKYGCGTGECGACTVLIDGRPMLSCLVLAVNVSGRKVTTIEGLSKMGELNPIQQAFVDKGAIQCGFCTPGLVMTAKALLTENPKPSEAYIREYIRGNLCRCTGYAKVVEAIAEAARRVSKK
jgi:carbon-monoxide dehydrogenase small subunit